MSTCIESGSAGRREHARVIEEDRGGSRLESALRFPRARPPAPSLSQPHAYSPALSFTYTHARTARKSPRVKRIKRINRVLHAPRFGKRLVPIAPHGRGSCRPLGSAHTRLRETRARALAYSRAQAAQASLRRRRPAHVRSHRPSPPPSLSHTHTHKMDALFGGGARRQDYEGIEFWHSPERAGWLMKQGASRLG